MSEILDKLPKAAELIAKDLAKGTKAKSWPCGNERGTGATRGDSEADARM